MTGIDADKLAQLSEDDKKVVTKVRYPHKKAAFLQVAVLPTFMLFCYVALFLFFRSKGGYRPIDLSASH